MRKALLYIRILIWSAALFASSQCNSQGLLLARETLSSTGGSFTLGSGGNQYQVQQSIGQASVIGLYQSNAYQARQGFIQPQGLGLKAFVTDDIQWMVSPNPFHDVIQLETESSVVASTIYVTLSDLSGREVLVWHLEGLSSHRLSCTDLPVGSYLLTIRSNQSIQTIQVIRS
jgi:hypothetical protein